ncbi:hypothetical protein B0H15DRAFT_864499 [Mycena belliarum]|uniref:MYND-type domain-containing protein n=1 Tax=Mycena belliarum TaxID=1033014 RepID=A0AAD6TQL5_9AGAR|nr:hypothetical protein B0H15DRAFT_864499 [Mycena belliae]
MGSESSTTIGSPDFTNETHFPAYTGLPSEYTIDRRYFFPDGSPAGHWCFLAEIKESVTSLMFTRPLYNVRDRDGVRYLVAYHLEDRARFPLIVEQCKDGYTMCIMYAHQHLFADGQRGIRVEMESSVKILPCSLKSLFSIRDKVLKLKNSGFCNGCGDNATLKCARCRLFYCTKSCQLADWNYGEHKNECKVAQQISEWGTFDWDSFDEHRLFEIPANLRPGSVAAKTAAVAQAKNDANRIFLRF